MRLSLRSFFIGSHFSLVGIPRCSIGRVVTCKKAKVAECVQEHLEAPRIFWLELHR
jgi:hypothetical protein